MRFDILYLLTVLTLVVICPPYVMSQDTSKLMSKKKVQKYKSSELDDDISLIDRNKHTGIYDVEYSTKSDVARVGIAYHFNPFILKIMDFSSFEVTYAKHYKSFWWEFFGAKTATKFSKVADNNSNLGADSHTLRDTREDLWSFGTGLSFRLKTIQYLLDWEGIFETTSIYLGYYKFSENFRNEIFNGVGLRVDLGIHKRYSKRYHWGIKFSYNLAPVKKSNTTGNLLSYQRSLTISWVSAAFELAMYF